MRHFSRLISDVKGTKPGAISPWIIVVLSGALIAGKPPEKPLRPPANVAKALQAITPADLRADLSFLSSDALAGRDTPSPGLEAAAEFIASRFRRAGLEGPVNGDYFQTADLTPLVKQLAERRHREPPDRPIVGRNVIGILRGSDPVLRETYVIVSAHYDHIGTVDTVAGRTMEKKAIPGDTIYNGANDDGSGTVSVVALAETFSRLRVKPKRSLVFIAFCGEELGLLGSRFYTEHPVVPLKQTIANINLEQVGRTDGDISKGRASLTGFEFTTLGKLFARAGLAYGLTVYQDKNSARYFTQSDNVSFARFGIPDNTICTAFEFPDYHGLKDEWPKIDYDSMAAVDRVVGDVVWQLADSKTPPTWNAAVPQTERYRKAARETYGAERSEPLTPAPATH
jgi:Zn-dependent M28 family amino/carboxypeptidase